MAHTFRQARTLGIAAASAAVLTLSLSAAHEPGPKELDAMLARFDRQPAGAAKDTLAVDIDRVAHQKYATVSRLFWYTNLASAEAAAHEQGRPILHLRMLGKLDEDLSCANSRFFRATLYANQEVSRFLREHFVLYWSSERPVPRVTIDYGDGRAIVSTTTGNSAHYVLDERGHVLDVLPGLYAPTAFRHELERSLALATSLRDASDSERAARLVEYHQARLVAGQRDWERLAGTPWVPGVRQLLTEGRIAGEAAAAQRATLSKAAVELPRLHTFMKGLAPESVPEDQIEMWSVAGQVVYGLRDWVLDDASRALVVRLHNAVPRELRGTDEQVDRMIERLEQTIVADTALNQLRLRPMIEHEIVRQGGRVEFGALNAWIYAEVFRTPSADAWLGLLPRDVFTGLPGDGVAVRR
jgi:hypothetical protein